MLPALYMLYAVNPEDDKSADGYTLNIAGKVESKDNYKFPNEDIHAVVRRLVLSYVNRDDIINE